MVSTLFSFGALFISALFFLMGDKERITIIQPAEQVHFAPMKNTSSVAMVLDPRTDAEKDKGTH